MKHPVIFAWSILLLIIAIYLAGSNLKAWIAIQQDDAVGVHRCGGEEYIAGLFTFACVVGSVYHGYVAYILYDL